MGLEPGQGRPTQQYDPDAELGRMFRVGCIVIFVVFLVGSALIGYLWLH